MCVLGSHREIIQSAAYCLYLLVSEPLVYILISVSCLDWHVICSASPYVYSFRKFTRTIKGTGYKLFPKSL